jgi:hypothetical protein
MRPRSARPPTTPPTMPPIAPPERPELESAGADIGVVLAEAEADPGTDAEAEAAAGVVVAEEAPGVVEVWARRDCWLIVKDAAEGLARLSDK